MRRLYGTALVLNVKESLKDLEEQGLPCTIANLLKQLNPYTSKVQKSNLRIRIYNALKTLEQSGEVLKEKHTKSDSNIAYYIYSIHKS